MRKQLERTSEPCQKGGRLSVRRTSTRRGRCGKQRRGVTLVEFALVFPLLMATIIAMIELVRMSGIRHAADNAAYEAARHVIVPGATVAEGTAAAQDLLARGGVDSATVSVAPSPITDDTTSVTVQVDVPLSQNSWLPTALTNGTTISRRTTLITEMGAMLSSGS